MAKRGTKYLNYLLAFFAFARFGQLLVYLLIDNQFFLFIPFLTTVFSPLFHVVPAILYLYTVGFLNNRSSLKKIDYLHFLPGILILADNIYWHLSDHANLSSTVLALITIKDDILVVENGLFPSEVYLYFRPIMVTIYLYLSFMVYKKSKSLIKSQGGRIKRFWILSFLIMILLFHMINVFALYSRFNGLLYGEEYKFYSWLVVMPLLLFMIVMMYLINNPRFLYGYILVNLGEKNKIVELKILKQAEISRPIITDSDLEFVQSFQQYMTAEKPYLKSDFQLIDVANYYKMPIHQCSAMINNLLGGKFRDLINSYRVNDFINSYPKKSQTLTLEAIAFESGFTSMTTFYRAFKNETGKIPLAYFSD